MAWMPWQLFVSPLLKGEGQEHFRAALWHIGCAPNLSSSSSMQPLPGNLLSQHPPNRGRGAWQSTLTKWAERVSCRRLWAVHTAVATA